MYWMIGLSRIGSISLGMALVWGRKRVPSPAAAMTALRTNLFSRSRELVMMVLISQAKVWQFGAIYLGLRGRDDNYLRIKAPFNQTSFGWR